MFLAQLPESSLEGFPGVKINLNRLRSICPQTGLKQRNLLLPVVLMESHDRATVNYRRGEHTPLLRPNPHQLPIIPQDYHKLDEASNPTDIDPQRTNLVHNWE